MSHILHHVHSRRLAHTQTHPEHQEGSLSFGTAFLVFCLFICFFFLLGVSLEQLNGDLFGPLWMAQMGERAPESLSWFCMCRKLSRFSLAGRSCGSTSKQGGKKLEERQKVQRHKNSRGMRTAQIRNEDKNGKRAIKKTKWSEFGNIGYLGRSGWNGTINTRPRAIIQLPEEPLFSLTSAADNTPSPTSQCHPPSQSLTASRLLWLPHGTFVLALKWWPSTAVWVGHEVEQLLTARHLCVCEWVGVLGGGGGFGEAWRRQESGAADYIIAQMWLRKVGTRESGSFMKTVVFFFSLLIKCSYVNLQ